jgi:hypothetical protein
MYGHAKPTEAGQEFRTPQRILSPGGHEDESEAPGLWKSFEGFERRDLVAFSEFIRSIAD